NATAASVAPTAPPSAAPATPRSPLAPPSQPSHIPMGAIHRASIHSPMVWAPPSRTNDQPAKAATNPPRTTAALVPPVLSPLGVRGAASACGLRLARRLLDVGHEDRDVVPAAVPVGLRHQPLARTLGIGLLSQDAGDALIGDHLSEAVRTQQQYVARVQV